MHGCPSGLPRRAAPILALIALVSYSCGGGGDGGCPTCPPPSDAALRIRLAFDAAARGLEPAGFRIEDMSRIDVSVVGGVQGDRTITLTPPQDATFLDVRAGSYVVSATGYQGTDLILFTSGGEAVNVIKGDTAEVTLEMAAALGEVALEVGGLRTGSIEAVAGEDVPFVVTVRNAQGRPVPDATVIVRSGSGFGAILAEGTDATDLEGKVRGVVRAPHSGVVGGFTVLVDDHPVPVPGTLQVEFATAVDPAQSQITTLSNPAPLADGRNAAQFSIVVRNVEGEPLAGVPVTVSSSRNAGVDKSVDLVTPLPGFESGTTDDLGRFFFNVTSTTSFFMELDQEGRLFSRADAGRILHPAAIRIHADGVLVDQRNLDFVSVVNPTGAGLTIAPQFVPAGGQGAEIEVRVRELPSFGADPVTGVFVEITDASHTALNYTLDIQPLPGFNGFRTNAQGVWRGRIRSSQPATFFFEAKADGRALIVVPRSVIFTP